MFEKEVQILRFLAIAEGISLLILLFVAMPLKYIYHLPQAVTMIGWVHGVLFIGFVFYAGQVSRNRRWPDSFLIMLVIFSMIPFGMIYMEYKIRQIVAPTERV
jgi:integral membrane protein